LIFIIIAYPLYFIVIASFSNAQYVSQGKVVFLPKGVSLYGYKKIFEDSRIWLGYKNTIVYTLGGTLINILFTLPAAYALSRKRFRARKLLCHFLFLQCFSMVV
jgi:putative aldouronate transport system permease protein